MERLKEYIRKIVKEEMGGATMNAQEMARHKKKLEKLKKILATQGDQMIEYPKSLPNTVFNAKLMNEDLRDWFGTGGKGGVGGGGWDRYNSSGDRIGKCGDAKEGDAYSACLSKEKAEKLGKEGRAAFVKRKRAAQKKGGDAKKGGEKTKGQKPIKVKTGINEIGEGSAKPYPYKVESENTMYGDIIYSFKTDSGLDYEITISQLKKTRDQSSVRLDVGFKTDSGTYDTITNQGEQYRIMATVLAAVKEYLAKVPNADSIVFIPSKSDEGDMRRADFYKAYIKKQLPGSEVRVFGDGRYIVELPKNESILKEIELFLEKNIPTDKSKWSYYKSQAKKKFDVYPSAYANAWAAKMYKKAGGGWRKS